MSAARNRHPAGQRGCQFNPDYLTTTAAPPYVLMPIRSAG